MRPGREVRPQPLISFLYPMMAARSISPMAMTKMRVKVSMFTGMQTVTRNYRDTANGPLLLRAM